MSSNLFEVMKLLESKRIHFTIDRTSPHAVTLTATLVGKRVEISVDEDDMIDVSIFRGDESVEVGMDAVIKAIEEDE
jgi:hypothetical protein